ncbi:MAG: hypothetical protein VX910_00680 [Candidatus Latescibacterota bacterium]|nr:hypothetical protein [Candidatus Latescibacterota bacterium]
MESVFQVGVEAEIRIVARGDAPGIEVDRVAALVESGAGSEGRV